MPPAQTAGPSIQTLTPRSRLAWRATAQPVWKPISSTRPSADSASISGRASQARSWSSRTSARIVAVCDPTSAALCASGLWGGVSSEPWKST